MNRARLSRYGLLAVTGADARAFLHAQLTNDVQQLPADRAALAGWCSAKGRLLASFLVIPAGDGFLLQLARDLAAPVAKRLSMFVLRSKVKIADVSDAWAQFGVWDADFQQPELAWEGDRARIRIGERRYLELIAGQESSASVNADESQWTLQEIRAGRPLITAATQDQFVPQMVNLENLGAVDFKKGCYPGQEIVARAQYRGQVKRRMVHAKAPAGATLAPGQDFNGGTVVDVAPTEDGMELLAVMPQ
ncbi:MAG TPA: folate-binding protein [Burkholderiales bacterium]|nr:folate-binding protein [Burkholderiales bacterium]